MKETDPQPRRYRIPLWGVAAILVIFCMAFYIYRMHTTQPLKAAEEAKKEIVLDIDSLETKRTADIKDVVKNSQHQAIESERLKQSLPHEKPLIRDTTYSAMRRYITDYKPE